MKANREHGLDLEGWEGRPKWGYERMDSWTVDVLLVEREDDATNATPC